MQRERMADIRARKKRRRPPECRQCPRVAHVDPETGRVMSACRYHLDEDSARVIAAREKSKEKT